jgi:hypothetical protein
LTSIFLNILAWGICQNIKLEEKSIIIEDTLRLRQNNFLSNLLWVYLVFIASIMVWTNFYYTPAIPDLVSMKLPKIHFYLQQGNLLPDIRIADARMFVAPINATLLEMLLYNYQMNLHYYFLPGFLSWLGIGLSLYIICRELGASKIGSFIAIWFFILTEQLILQGSSENDDILNGFSISVSLMFGLIWFKHKSRFAAIILGLGIGISIGIKPIILFIIPAILLHNLYYVFKNGFSFVYSWYRKEIVNLIYIALAIFLAASNSYIANYKVYGEFSQKSGYINSVINRPFNLKCGLQNLYVHSFTLLSNPVFNIENTNNQNLHSYYKEKVKPFFKFTKGNEECLNHSLSNYEDIHISAPQIHESTLAFDFFPVIALFSFFTFVFSDFRNKNIVIWLNLCFTISLILFLLNTKYIGPIFRYWIPIFLFLVPNIAFGWDIIKSKQGFKQRMLVIIFCLNFIFTILFAWKGLNFHNQKNLSTMILYESENSMDVSFSYELRDLIKKLNKYNLIFYNTFNYLYLFYINPNAIVTILDEPVDDYPNIVYFLSNSKAHSLNTNNYSPKYIPVKFPESFNMDDAYYDFGLMYGHKAFINNIPIQKNKKKYFLFKWIWVDMAQMKGYPLLLNSLKKNPNLEFKFVVYEPNKTQKTLQDWSGEISKELIIPKDSITFEILVRERNVPNQVFFGKWPVNEWHDIGIN